MSKYNCFPWETVISNKISFNELCSLRVDLIYQRFSPVHLQLPFFQNYHESLARDSHRRETRPTRTSAFRQTQHNKAVSWCIRPGKNLGQKVFYCKISTRPAWQANVYFPVKNWKINAVNSVKSRFRKRPFIKSKLKLIYYLK